MTNYVLGSTRRAAEWFLRSGIQHPEGGIARYFRQDTGKNHPVSTEITGYGASALAWLHGLTGESGIAVAAERAARFLTETAWDRELQTFPFEWGDASPRLSYFFDCGMIVRGLLSAWRLTRTESFLEVAKSCGRAMARDFAGGGQFHPVLALPEKTPVAGDGRWSRHPGCYQLKSAMAWFDLFEETRDAEFLQAYENALAYSLRTHHSFLDSEPERERVMDRLHAYSYFLEGLLPVLERPECKTAMVEGIERIAYYLDRIAPEFERSDVCAQLLRLRLISNDPGSGLEAEASRIEGFQFKDRDPRVDGGFCFGRKGGAILPFVNPVSTAFCAQALEMCRKYRTGEFVPDRRSLI